MVMQTYRDENGIERLLSWVPPDSGKLMMRASRISLQTLRSQRGLPPLIPESEWLPRDYVTGSPLELITDQLQYGACTAFTGVGADNRQRFCRGMDWEPLSGFYVYDMINGGRDAGSNIIDCMGVMRETGAPPLSVYPKPLFKAYKKLPPGTKMYKGGVECTLATSAECATAIQMGIFPQVPIRVFSGFEQFDGDGVAGVTSSTNGNHSIYLAGMKRLPNNEWVFLLVNSWNKKWGPFKNGTCWIRRRAIDACAMAEDGYGHAAVEPPVALAA